MSPPNVYFQRVKSWLRRSRENAMIAAVVGLGFVLSIGILTIKKGGAGGGGHDSHGHEEGHGEEEEEGEEGSVELDDDAVEGSGISIEQAINGRLTQTLRLRAQVTANRDKEVRVAPRFPGTVKQLLKDLGDDVKKDDILAVIESNSAHATFEVRSGISGTIVDRRASRGGFASNDEPLFTIVDLANVWVEISVPDRYFSTVKRGQILRVRDPDRDKEVEGTIAYVSQTVSEDTQALLVRAIIPNPDREWRPGTFVETEIEIGTKDVGVMIREEALQTLENRTVVFARHGEHFESRVVELGDRGRGFVEVRKGLREGESYAAANSFIVKAELLKSTAEHAH